VLYAADQALARARHGDKLTSLTGRHLFAKAALISAPSASRPAPGVDGTLTRALDHTYEPVRALIAAAPDDIRASLVLYYETCLQGPCVAAVRDSIPLDEAALNERLREAATRRIRAAPAAFARLTLTHYLSLWTAYKLRHPEAAATLTAFLASHRPLPFEREAFRVGPNDPIVFPPSEAVLWLQPLIAALGVLTGAVAVAGVMMSLKSAAPAPLLAAALASMTAHAALVFTAVAAAGISRFMIAVFPAVIVSAGLSVWWLFGQAFERTTHARYH
jgi:hypothetical protein